MNEKMLIFWLWKPVEYKKQYWSFWLVLSLTINPIAGHMSPGTNVLDSPLFGSGTHYIQ